MAVPTRFVLSRQVLICIRKCGRTFHLVPFDPGPWSPVGDHFGDHFDLHLFRSGWLRPATSPPEYEMTALPVIAFFIFCPAPPLERFAQCGTWKMWVDDNLCALHGSNPGVTAGMSCGLYVRGDERRASRRFWPVETRHHAFTDRQPFPCIAWL